MATLAAVQKKCECECEYIVAWDFSIFAALLLFLTLCVFFIFCICVGEKTTPLNLYILSSSLLDNVVIYSEKDEFDKLKAPPQKTVKRWATRRIRKQLCRAASVEQTKSNVYRLPCGHLVKGAGWRQRRITKPRNGGVGQKGKQIRRFVL